MCINNGNTRRWREKGTEEIVEVIIADNLLKLMTHKTADPVNSENNKEYKCKYLKNLYLGVSYSNCRKSKTESWKKSKEAWWQTPSL